MTNYPALREALECPNLDAPMHTSTNCTYCAHTADAREELKEIEQALVAMVYVHPCQCGAEFAGATIPAGTCARCRAVKTLGFDPAR